MYLLFDIGGTNIRLATSLGGNNLLSTRTIRTNLDFNEAISEMEKNVKEMTDGKSIDFAAGGVRALDKTKTKLLNQPHFPLWVDAPLKLRLEEIFSTEVQLENDSAVVGLGEAIRGAGMGYPIVAYVTISTGVGGARIVDGKIDKSFQGFEPGNQIIDLEGTTLEAYISGEALRRKYGKSAQEIDDPDIWDDVAKKLAIGLNNLSVIWSPEIIVLGGSVMKKISLDTTKGYLKKYLNIFPQPPKLELSALGDTGGLYGALSIAQNI